MWKIQLPPRQSPVALVALSIIQVRKCLADNLLAGSLDHKSLFPPGSFPPCETEGHSPRREHQPHCAALMAAEPLHTSCTHSSMPCWERALLPERFWSFAEAGRALVDALCLAHTLTRCRWRRKRAGSPRTGCDCCAGNGSIPVPVTNHRVHPGEVAVKSGHT